MHGQGGWKGLDNTLAAGALVSDANDPVGAGAVEILPSSDLVHEFDVTGGMIEFTVMQYIPSGGTGETFFILLNSYNDAGVNEGFKDWSVVTKFNLATGVITADDVATEATVLFDEWVEFKCMIDLDDNIVDEYYNGVLIKSQPWDTDDDGGIHNTLQCIDLWGNNASSVYYDNITVVAQ
jgi:hypothetical protein